MLPDDVLVEIFNFHLNIVRSHFSTPLNVWHALVRVCRRWRCLVFASPRRLKLQLNYSGHGPASEVLDAWPGLPVVLLSYSTRERWVNMVAALESEHHNRICEIHINGMTNPRWEGFAAAMQKPFPELTRLSVSVDGDVVPVLPGSFLGGYAPRLRELRLSGVPFPSIPKLLLSANGLVVVTLDDIPDSGYISPDAMATALTVMTRLERLELRFRPPQLHPDPESRPLPPPTRFVLPALTKLKFQGVYEYLEDLLARIDAPLLYDLSIVFFMDADLNADIPDLHQLISHAEEFKAIDHANVSISHYSLKLSLSSGAVDHSAWLVLEILCENFDLRISSLLQVCSSSRPLISTLEELKIVDYKLPSSHFIMEDDDWLDLLEPFTAVENLYLADDIARRASVSFQKLSGERATEVLPSLRNLFVDGFQTFKHIQAATGPFVAARQLSGHPVAIKYWRRW